LQKLHTTLESLTTSSAAADFSPSAATTG